MNKIIKLRKIAVSFILIITIAIGIFPVVASAVTISPIRLELSADPGQTVSSSFKVFNEQSKAKTLYITFARFETKDETGDPAFVPGSGGLPSWVQAPASILAPSKQYVNVPFTIIVPKDVDPGGYFAGIFASELSPQEQNGSQVTVQSDVGTLILFRVNGEFKEGETILEFNMVNKHHWLSSLPAEFYYRFQNSGADRAKPLGDVIIKNIFGMTRKIVNANPSAGSTLPQSIRRYQAAWVTSGGDKTEGNTASVEYLPKNSSWLQTLRWQWQHFALGRYSANLQVTVNNDSSRSYKAHTSFWVIPWQLLITIFAGLFIIFAGATIVAIIVVLLIIRYRRKK